MGPTTYAGGVLSFGSSTVTNGVKVTVAKPKVVRPSQYSSDGPYALVTVKLTNESARIVDPSLTVVDLAYGKDGTSAQTVYDTPTTSDFEQNLLPGRSLTAAYGFAVPTADLSNVVVEVSGGESTLDYTGSVTPLR